MPLIFSITTRVIEKRIINLFWLSNLKSCWVVVGVDYPIRIRLFFLIKTIYETKNLSPDNLIISIDENKNLVSFTVIMSCIINIICGKFLILVSDISYSVFWKSDRICIFLSNLQSSIIRWIINKNDMIVCVILIKNCLNIFLETMIFNIIMTQYNNTEW